MIQRYKGDEEFIELVDSLVRPGVTEVSRWAKVVIAINTVMDIQDYDSKIYYMSLGAKLLFGELSEFNLEHYTKAEYIDYANKLLRMGNNRYINKSDLGIIAQYIRTYDWEKIKSGSGN